MGAYQPQTTDRCPFASIMLSTGQISLEMLIRLTQNMTKYLVWTCVTLILIKRCVSPSSCLTARSLQQPRWTGTGPVSSVLITWPARGPRWVLRPECRGCVQSALPSPIKAIAGPWWFMKGNGERINVAEALRLMIKQIAAPLQILSGAEVLLRARHVVVSSINCHGVGEASAKTLSPSSRLPQWNTHSNSLQVSRLNKMSSLEIFCQVYLQCHKKGHIYLCQCFLGTSRNASIAKYVEYRQIVPWFPYSLIWLLS